MSTKKEIPDDLLNKGNEKEEQGKPKTSAGKSQAGTSTKKRQFDKHSGTGRGKEIAKNGGGGKFTWGTNEASLTKEAQMGYEDENADEDYEGGDQAEDEK